MGDAASPRELLRKYLETDSEDTLATLVLDHALPVIHRVVERRLGVTPRETIEDVCGTATAWLIASLRRYREEQSAVRDFPAWVGGIATKAAAQFIADQSPERARLRRRIRLLCSSDNRFFLTGSEGRWLCGLRTHAGRITASPQAIEQSVTELSATRLPLAFPAFAEIFFRSLGAPVDLSEATAAFAALLGVPGPPQSLDALAREPVAPPLAPSRQPPAPEWILRLWAEIRQLPAGQRTALLLNLRLPYGSAIELFEELGVADIASLAEVLEMSAARLAELWGSLPLDDLQIAARLGITRQQVINLRAAARERLRRRTPIFRQTAGL